MRISERPEALTSAGRLSLILPLNRGRTLSGETIAEYRRILEQGKGFESIEVVTAGMSDVGLEGSWPDGQGLGVSTHVETDGSDWSVSARAGLAAATGDHLVVLDVDRHYPPESLHRVVGPVWEGDSDLAVAVPTQGHGVWDDGGNRGSASACSAGCCWAPPTCSRGCSRSGDRSGSGGGEPSRPAVPAWSSSCCCDGRPAPSTCRSRSIAVPLATVGVEGPAPAEARARRPLRQLFPAGPVLHGRRLGHGRRPDVLRAVPVAALVHLAGFPDDRVSVSPGNWRSPRPSRSRSHCSGTSP